jgi:hypothetical protein
MSLVASASPWNNDDSANKKRQSTMRKTIKIRSNNQDIPPFNNTKMEYDTVDSSSKPTTILEQNDYNANRNDRVNDLLNKITSVDTQNSDDNKMGDFKPLSHPSVNVKKDMDVSFNSESKPNVNYKANDYVSSIYSNYNKSYDTPNEILNKPYYIPNKNNYITNINPSNNQFNNDKIMERINYMIHLIEETKLEKTSNITEEFILYTFLGIFVIFVVDSFSRSRRYTR